MYQGTQTDEKQSIFRNIDWFTVIIYLLMVAAGAVSIYAACYDFDEASLWSYDEFSGKQLRWVGAGFVLGLVLLLVETRVYETYAYVVYAVVIILLAVTPFLARDIHGSRSWIGVGSMSLQPAEFAKFATALALAKMFSGYNFVLNAKLSNYVRAVGVILLPMVLIIFQHETGSALVFLSLFFVLYREGMSGLVLFAALVSVVVFVVVIKYNMPGALDMPEGQFWILIGVMAMMVAMLMYYGRKRLVIARNVLLWFAGVGALTAILANYTSIKVPGLAVMLTMIGVALLYVSFEIMRTRLLRLGIPIIAAGATVLLMFTVEIAFKTLAPYQQKRIELVLGVIEDSRGVGYNVNQSKIAIGSGGLTGKGFLNGTQTKLKYVPEQHTDFIFCTIGEEEGFWGAMTVLALFLILILRVIHIAERQPDTFGRVYAYCVACYFMIHVCVNIGMVIGLCPVIGIPLPFFSYGGSSMLGFTILLFVLLRIDASRKTLHN